MIRSYYDYNHNSKVERVPGLSIGKEHQLRAAVAGDKFSPRNPPSDVAAAAEFFSGSNTSENSLYTFDSEAGFAAAGRRRKRSSPEEEDSTGAGGLTEDDDAERYSGAAVSLWTRSRKFMGSTL